MEYTQVSNLDFELSRITLGTWALGGWQWGGTRQNKPVETILAAIDKGVTAIDTAPIYGFGESEKLVGKAVEEHGDRESLIIATKAGLEWDDDENVRRNSTRERIMYEVEKSLERLQTDYIDIYQIHWPDLNTPFEETALVMNELFEREIIRAIGVSNYSVAQMKTFMDAAPIHVCQPPFNLFEREAANELIPFCNSNDVTLLTYGALCRGLLSGKMDESQTFDEGDLRKSIDPKFQGDRFRQYLEAVDKLDDFAGDKYDRRVIDLAVRWILDNGVDSAIWGARKPEQVEVDDVFGWELSDGDLQEIDRIISGSVEDPVGPDFMAPPE